MRRLLVASIGLLLVWASSAGFAGQYRHHGYYGGGYYGKGYHARGYPGRPHYRYRGHRHSNDDAAWLLGGLVLGSVITHAYQNNYSRHYDRVRSTRYYRTYPAERQVIYRTRVIERPAETAIPGRHLYRDLAGNCFEILRNDQGDQLREELPPEECNW